MKFYCPYCPGRLSRKEEFVVHLFNHMGDVFYSCSVCGMVKDRKYVRDFRNPVDKESGVVRRKIHACDTNHLSWIIKKRVVNLKKVVQMCYGIWYLRKSLIMELYEKWRQGRAIPHQGLTDRRVQTSCRGWGSVHMEMDYLVLPETIPEVTLDDPNTRGTQTISV